MVMLMIKRSEKMIMPLLLFLILSLAPAAEAGGIPLKVVILTTYTVEDIARVPLKYSLEIKHWYDKNFSDAEYYRVKGTSSYIYIKDGLAFITIARGKKGAVSSLSALLKDKTVLVIAHRMRTVMGADHVVVLADGHVAEEGTPEQLMERGGMFRHMVELQRESSNWQVGGNRGGS